MRLLFDQNLSPRLVGLLADVFPRSEHVRHVGLATADDRDVWEYAKRNALAIVSKDGDFRQLSFTLGAPPKVVWVRIGNPSTDQIHAALRTHVADLAALDADPSAALLVIGIASR